MSIKTTLRAGRPSANTKTSTLASLSEDETMKRVNFELSPDRHIKLKIYATKTGKSIREIFTEYIDNLPN